MEQYPTRSFLPELSEDSSETNYGLISAQRINILISSVDGLIDSGASQHDLMTDRAINTFESWQVGRWKGVTLTSEEVSGCSDTAPRIGDCSIITLERNTDGRSKITIENESVDTYGYPCESRFSFELSPQQPDIKHTAVSDLYGSRHRPGLAGSMVSSQEEIRRAAEIILSAAERTITSVMQKTLIRAIDPSASPVDHTTLASFEGTQYPIDIPPSLERPTLRALKVKSIMDLLERVTVVFDETDGYFFEDGFYNFVFKRTPDGRYAKIISIKSPCPDFSDDSDELLSVEGDETCMQIVQSRGGTVQITLDMKRADLYGNIRPGKDTYLFSYQQDSIEHTGTGFSFDLFTGAPSHNKNINDQSKLHAELQQILEATEGKLLAIDDSLNEEL